MLRCFCIIFRELYYYFVTLANAVSKLPEDGAEAL